MCPRAGDREGLIQFFFVMVSFDYAGLSTLTNFCFYSAPLKVTSVSNLFVVEIIRVMLSAPNNLQPKDSRRPLSLVHCFRQLISEIKKASHVDWTHTDISFFELMN